MPANSQCVVLCLALGPIEHRTDEGLRELERRGYKVWRSKGFSAIDQGRNVLAADALHQGFHETLWIDPDVAFEPDAVDRLRSHKLPIVAGINPQKGRRWCSARRTKQSASGSPCRPATPASAGRSGRSFSRW